MAGIGFALRDLLRQDGLWGLVESQLHGVVAVAGPWFFTIIAMALPSLLFHGPQAKAESGVFVAVLLYAFAISLVWTSPIAIALTRHVSDCLYQRRQDEVAKVFAAALLLGLASLIIVAPAALWCLELPTGVVVQGLAAYGLVTVNWIAAPLLSTIKQFRALTAAFALGTGLFALYLRATGDLRAGNLLVGFNLGMALTDALVCGLILLSFSASRGTYRALLGAIAAYWDMALGGLLYGLGIWVDKWLMWQAPEHATFAGGLVSYPLYDTSVFVAYVTTVPALGLFIIKAETAFHEACDRLYRSIQNHAHLGQLEAARAGVVSAFFQTGRDVALLQVALTVLAVAVPAAVLALVGLPQTGVFMFRFCAIGAAFQSAVLMLCIVLHYFDSRRAVLQVNAVFFVLNAAMTWLALRGGLPWYGLGYMVAAVATFAFAYWLVQRAFGQLLFLAFVRQNAAVVNAPVYRAPPEERFTARIGAGPEGR